MNPADLPQAATLVPLTDEMIQRARSVQNGRNLIAELERLTGSPARSVLAALAARLALPVIETAEMATMVASFDRIALTRAQQRGCALLQQPKDAPNNHSDPWVGVISDPFDVDTQSWLERHAPGSIAFRLALPSDIQAYLSKQESSVKAIDHLVDEIAPPPDSRNAAEVLSLVSVNDSASPAVRLLSSTLYDALKAGASDIHLESTPSGLTVKYRIDGVLNQEAQMNGVTLAEQTISRLKVLAELDIAERRTPQDGSFRVQSAGRDIDLRVSIMPSVHGEDAVIRVLDKQTLIEQHGKLSLDALGFNDAAISKLRLLVEQPYGMVLVTGPTGSGKTTTLYAALSEVNDGRDKIITIEDPVEYQLPGILQIPVNDKKGLSFARGLRSILRHDPDKIMVGEIRDSETAEIAVQSALTGHLVLTTVHANSVFDVFGRFTHMGLDPYAFASALNGVWAQRLVRINCPHCSQDYEPDAQELARVVQSLAEDGQPQSALAPASQFRRGVGCGDCRGTGYRGRRAIAEILIIDDELRELIVEKRPIRYIKEHARAAGTRTLAEAALDLVRQGHTTFEELRRVTLST